MEYIFHCGEYKTERSFKEGIDEFYVEESFSNWIHYCGLDCDELDEMIAEGDAGYYEI